jgi:hypothetical protein
MSVMAQLKKFSSGETTEPYKRPQGPNVAPEIGETEAIMQTAAIPGQSLTQDPENRMPFEKPPKFTDPQEFIDDTFMKMTDPERLPLLLDSMRHQMPIEHLAQKYLMAALVGGVNPLDVTSQTAVTSMSDQAGEALYGKAGDLSLAEQTDYINQGRSSTSLLDKAKQGYDAVKGFLPSDETAGSAGYGSQTQAIQSARGAVGNTRGQGSAGFSLLGGVRGLEQSVRNSQNSMFA